MEATERDFHDNSSSYDEILDFEWVRHREDSDYDAVEKEYDEFYRSLDDY